MGSNDRMMLLLVENKLQDQLPQFWEPNRKGTAYTFLATVFESLFPGRSFLVFGADNAQKVQGKDIHKSALS